MAGPSSLTLQEQLDKLNDLTFAELCKGDNRNEGLVKDLQRQLEILSAQISRQTSGEALNITGLCCAVDLQCAMWVTLQAMGAEAARWKGSRLGSPSQLGAFAAGLREDQSELRTSWPGLCMIAFL